MTTADRRAFLASAAIASLSGAALAGSDKLPMPRLVHHVFFWLKRPDSKADRDRLLAGLATLTRIETVRGYHFGVPAATEKRDVVDNSFSVSEILLFDDTAGTENLPGSSRASTVRRGLPAASIVLAIATARPLLGSFDQAFQYIQEYTGFFTPGIVVIFLLGLFWKKATEIGAMTATIGSFVMSIALKALWPELPFMDRMEIVFLLALVLAVVSSLLWPAPVASNRIEATGVNFRTSPAFNIGSVGVLLVLVALYASWW
jgi:SSS family solute:Na+ symporter